MSKLPGPIAQVIGVMLPERGGSCLLQFFNLTLVQLHIPFHLITGENKFL